jgi:hypothetical protein
MNKFFLSILFTLFTIFAHCQTVKVNKQNEKVKGESIEAYAVTLDGKKEDISSAWSKFLKDAGKVRPLSNPIAVADPILNGTTYVGKSFYADSKKNNETTSTVWAGLNSSEWDQVEVEKASQGLEKLVYQFGVTYYRNKVQEQIDETQQALDAVEKQKQRTINQNKDLALKLTNNEQEKIKLEKSIENNKLENVALKIKIENNLKAQDSLANADIQIKKVLESHKEKQKKIN